MIDHNAYPCQRMGSRPQTRREMLSSCASGFGALALAALQSDRSFASEDTKSTSPVNAGHGPHHKVRAKNVIFLYMDGGPSQVDTFDPKPMLDKFNGKDPKTFLTSSRPSSTTTERFWPVHGSSSSMANPAFPSANYFLTSPSALTNWLCCVR